MSGVRVKLRADLETEHYGVTRNRVPRPSEPLVGTEPVPDPILEWVRPNQLWLSKVVVVSPVKESCTARASQSCARSRGSSPSVDRPQASRGSLVMMSLFAHR